MTVITNESVAEDAPSAAHMSAAAISRSRRIRQWRDGWHEFRRNRAGVAGLVILLAVIVVALLAPVMVPKDTLNVTKVTLEPYAPPTLADPLGADQAGRPVLGMLVWGTRVSLTVGFVATVMSTFIGTMVGMAAGHFRGLAQAVLMRVIDFFLVVPSLVLAITLSSVIGGGFVTIIIAIGITGWAGTARLVRSQTLSVESRPYIERSLALGGSAWHIITVHVLPAVMPLVLAHTTLAVGSAIIAESTLSFLGLGDASHISWGSMLKTAMDSGASTAGYWWIIIPPGAAIAVIVLAFTLVGRALEAVFNPALREG